MVLVSVMRTTRPRLIADGAWLSAMPPYFHQVVFGYVECRGDFCDRCPVFRARRQKHQCAQAVIGEAGQSHGNRTR
jgi:hypothetical protein